MIISYSFWYSTIYAGTWSVNEKEDLLIRDNFSFRIYRLTADEWR